MERRLITGYLLSAASAFTFSVKGIFAKLLYGLGVDPVTLLALRFAIAIPLFWLAVFFFPSGKVSGKDILILVLSGLLGLYAAALADFRRQEPAGDFLRLPLQLHLVPLFLLQFERLQPGAFLLLFLLKKAEAYLLHYT